MSLHIGEIEMENNPKVQTIIDSLIRNARGQGFQALTKHLLAQLTYIKKEFGTHIEISAILPCPSLINLF